MLNAWIFDGVLFGNTLLRYRENCVFCVTQSDEGKGTSGPKWPRARRYFSICRSDIWYLLNALIFEQFCVTQSDVGKGTSGPKWPRARRYFSTCRSAIWYTFTKAGQMTEMVHFWRRPWVFQAKEGKGPM